MLPKRVKAGIFKRTDLLAPDQLLKWNLGDAKNVRQVYASYICIVLVTSGLCIFRNGLRLSLNHTLSVGKSKTMP